MNQDRKEDRKAKRAERRKNYRNGLWPPIEDLHGAKRCARHGFWAALVSATLSAVLFGLLLAGGGPKQAASAPNLVWWAGADLLIMALISLGLWYYSRLAALLGVIFFVGSKITGWVLISSEVKTSALIIAALFTWFFILGLRGTIAVAKFGGDADEASS
jgi:hypothetical protein